MKTQDKSINNAEHIYEVPKLDKKTIQEIIANPYETRSGSDPRWSWEFLCSPNWCIVFISRMIDIGLIIEN